MNVSFTNEEFMSGDVEMFMSAIAAKGNKLFDDNDNTYNPSDF